MDASESVPAIIARIADTIKNISRQKARQGALFALRDKIDAELNRGKLSTMLEDYESQIAKQKEGSFLHKQLSKDIEKTRLAIRDRDFVVALSNGVLSNYQSTYASVLPLNMTVRPSDQDFVVLNQELINLNTNLVGDKLLKAMLSKIDIAADGTKQAVKDALNLLQTVSVRVDQISGEIRNQDLDANQKALMEKMDASYAHQLQLEELIKPLKEMMGDNNGVLEYIATEVGHMTQALIRDPK